MSLPELPIADNDPHLRELHRALGQAIADWQNIETIRVATSGTWARSNRSKDIGGDLNFVALSNYFRFVATIAIACCEALILTRARRLPWVNSPCQDDGEDRATACRRLLDLPYHHGKPGWRT